MKIKIKSIILISIIAILNFAVLINTVQAVENEQIAIYTKGNFNRFLKFDGMLIKTAHAVYNNNGIEFPAYCLNVELQGVGDKVATYETINEGKITDTGLWRVIVNGYPYKSIEQLGVANEEEAYTATKQAIYCYIYNRETSRYTGVGEAGERTVRAMAQIMENAKNSQEMIENPNAEMICDENWKQEEKYLIKEYEIKSNINISKYIVQLKGAPEGTVILDYNEQEKNEFSSNEKFKILIPTENLKESGNFKIKIQTQMETKPIFYGKSPIAEYQDYALTAYSYEDIEIEAIEQYEYEPIEEPEPEPEPEPEKEEVPVPEPVIEEVKRLPVTGM